MPRLLLSEDQALLICAHQDFTPDYAEALRRLSQQTSLDWTVLVDTAVKNRIGPLVHVNLEKAVLGLPPDVVVRLKKEYIDNLLRVKEARRRLEQALTNLQAWQAEYGIPLRLMLIKGAALNALVYNRPWYTRSHDIDLVIDILEADIPDNPRRQLLKTLEGINHTPSPYFTHLEFDFYAHHDMTMNGLLGVDVPEVWRHARPLGLDGHSLLIMSPEDILITATVACCRKRYFCLKPLMDLAECTRHLDGLDWSRVVEKALACQANGIAYTALWLANKLLDARTPEWVFSALKVARLHRFLIQRMAYFLLKYFSLAHLTKLGDGTHHPLSASLLFTYLTYNPAQLSRRIGMDMKSVFHA
jgi:hypothetical protein